MDSSCPVGYRALWRLVIIFIWLAVFLWPLPWPCGIAFSLEKFLWLALETFLPQQHQRENFPRFRRGRGLVLVSWSELNVVTAGVTNATQFFHWQLPFHAFCWLKYFCWWLKLIWKLRGQLAPRFFPESRALLKVSISHLSCF